MCFGFLMKSYGLIMLTCTSGALIMRANIESIGVTLQEEAVCTCLFSRIRLEVSCANLTL